MFENVWSRQAWLHAMQTLISSARPSRAFLTNSGSASSGLAIDTMSASPRARMSSATCGRLMRFDVTSGMLTSSFILRVTHVNALRGTDVAIVGTRASCQPMPVLMMVAPAFSIAFASITVSSHELPSGIRSIIDSR